MNFEYFSILNFQQVLSEVGFYYNTLRLHLAQLVEHCLVVKRKSPLVWFKY